MKKNLAGANKAKANISQNKRNFRMAAPNANAAVSPGIDDGRTTYVAKDMIWKAYVNKADTQAKNWNENWGFLVADQVSN